jgi:hypothetical protein
MMFDRFNRRVFATLALTASYAAVLLLAGALAAGTMPQKRRAPIRQAPVAPDAIVPFHSGEELTFRVLWSKFSVNAANAKFSVIERRDFFGHSAWHFRLQAQTIQTTRVLYALDDQFDSYTDAAHLASLQFEMYLNEQGKQQANVWRLLAPGDTSPSGNGTVAQVAAGTRDAIDFLYILRAQDWKHAPELRAPVFDGLHLYQIVARLGQTDGHVTVPAGSFTASRIDLHVSENSRELADTRFAVWLAQDAAHTPVLVEAEAPAPFGSARIELTTVK